MNNDIQPGFYHPKIAAAEKVTSFLNWSSFIVGVWTLTFPKPYLLAMSLILILPITGFIVFFYYKGVVTIDDSRDSPYPGLLFCFFLPSFCLMIRGYQDHELLNIQPIVYYSSIAAVIVFIVMNWINPKRQRTTFQKISYWIGGILVTFAFCFGSYTTINCTYDFSEAVVYETKLIAKEKSGTGRSTNYYLTLEPWGKFANTNEINVEREMFEQLTAGDKVKIALKPGRLKSEWYYILNK